MQFSNLTIKQPYDWHDKYKAQVMKYVAEKDKYGNNIQDIVTRWESGQINEMPVDVSNSYGVMNNGEPAFQFLKNKGFLIYQNKNSMEKNFVIIPGGYNGNEKDKDGNPTGFADDGNGNRVHVSDFKRLNPVQHRYAGDGALMSLLHVLVIPNQRIWNAVSLFEDRNMPYVIEDYKNAMKEGEKVIKKLISEDRNYPGSLSFWMDSENPVMAEPRDMASSFNMEVIRGFSPENYKPDFRYAFHIWPENSVGYLHMHVYDANFLTKSGENQEKANKNMPVMNVIDSLQALKQKYLKSMSTGVSTGRNSYKPFKEYRRRKKNSYYKNVYGI